MKYIYLVCGKNNPEDLNFWLVVATSSKESAEKWVKELDEENSNIYHYYFREPIL